MPPARDWDREHRDARRREHGAEHASEHVADPGWLHGADRPTISTKGYGALASAERRLKVTHDHVRRAAAQALVSVRVRRLEELLENLDQNLASALTCIDNIYLNKKGRAELPSVRVAFMDRVDELRTEIVRALQTNS